MDVMFEQDARESGRFPDLPLNVNVQIPTPRAIPTAQYKEYDEYESPEMEVKGFTSLEEMKKEYDKKNKARDAISAKLGERMLSGWIMLNRVCENDQCSSTPLMCKSSDKAHMECVACGTVWTEDESGDLVSTAAAFAAQPKAAPAPVSLRTPASSADSASTALDSHFSRLNQSDAPILNLFQRSDPNAPSELLAAKMLKGWALLEQCCQKDGCVGIPLMRDKAGVVQCVVCGNNKAQADSTATRSTSSSAAAKPAAAPVSSAVRFSTDLDESDDDEEDFDDADDNMAFSGYASRRLATLKSASSASSAQGSALPPPPSQAQLSPAESAKAPYTTKIASQSNLNVNNNQETEHSLQFVSSVLKSQMRHAATGLENAGGVRQASALAELITKLAVALKAVEGI